MLPRAKWLKNVSANDPVSRAARRALRERLRLVWHYLPLAALEPETDVEFIHQLRVATRRASAAMELFAGLLPKRRGNKLNKKLRKTRRAAGEARDLDVLATRVKLGEIELSAKMHKRVLEHLAECRCEAQIPVQAAFHKLEAWNYPGRIEKFNDRIRWRDEAREEPTFGLAARESLAPLARTFFDLALGDLSTPETLHRLRIAGKALRYALELLAGAFSPELRNDVYPQVEKIQKQLGEINDHAAAHARYRSWTNLFVGARAEAELTALIEREQQALAATSDAFRERWLGEPIDRLASALDRIISNGDANVAGTA